MISMDVEDNCLWDVEDNCVYTSATGMWKISTGLRKIFFATGMWKITGFIPVISTGMWKITGFIPLCYWDVEDNWVYTSLLLGCGR